MIRVDETSVLFGTYNRGANDQKWKKQSHLSVVSRLWPLFITENPGLGFLPLWRS